MTTRIAEEFHGTERFIVERRLGIGGMGVVYQAYDRQRDDHVALKTFRQLDAAAIYRIKQEFRTLADVTHPNLVALYELISEGEQWFFTMQLIDGVDFLSYVCQFRPLAFASTQAGDSSIDVAPETLHQEVASEADDEAYSAPRGARQTSPIAHVDFDHLRQALVQLAEGICALHRAGKLHRDIKPHNVLVTREGRVVLLDFGLATELDDTEKHEGAGLRRAVGTAAYMAPEQAAGLPLCEASDWYSVGVMLYQVLTGRLPFDGSVDEILLRKQMADAPPPGRVVSGVPHDLSELCFALLRRNPEHRPTGADVLRRLGGSPSDLLSSLAALGRHAGPFVGRRQHLEALNDAFASLKQGRTTRVFVHGRSGMGKSVLVERFLENLSRQQNKEVVVLAGRCYEQESVPYKALDSLIDALSRYLMHLSRLQVEALLPRDVASLARVFPVLRRVDAVAEAPGGRLRSPINRSCGVELSALCASLSCDWAIASGWCSQSTTCSGATSTART